MKPEVSAGCHQTLSRRLGLGTRLPNTGNNQCYKQKGLGLRACDTKWDNRITISCHMTCYITVWVAITVLKINGSRKVEHIPLCRNARNVQQIVRVHYFKSDYIIPLIGFQWGSLVCMVHQKIPFMWRWVWLTRMTPPLFPVTVGNCLFPSVHPFINFVPRPTPYFICIYNYTHVTAFLFCGNYRRTGFNCVV